MFTFSVMADVSTLARSLDAFAKRQLPFATAQALTTVARKIQAAEAAALPSIFDRPTLFTQRSIGVKAARKTDPTAVVFVKDIAAQYLEPFEFGGQHFLPPSKRGGTLLNPKNVNLNQYGNLPKTAMKRLTRRKDVFVGSVTFKQSGQTVNGIWQRPKAGYRKVNPKAGYKRTRGTMGALSSEGGVKTGLKLLVRFGDALPVRQSFGYRVRAAGVVQAEMVQALTAALAEAMRTAK